MTDTTIIIHNDKLLAVAPDLPLNMAFRVSDEVLASAAKGIVNREKLGQYSELYKRLGGYPYDQDPGRPGWTPILPNERFADPSDCRTVRVPY